jgi:multidrug transporter EmrE-like cation transporter
MWKIVYALMGAFGSALSAIIGMLWFMLRSDKERDIRFEKQEAKHVR